MKLIVLNLPRDFSEDALAKLFKDYGNIKACNLVLDDKTGTSKGFGFVEMALEHEADIAIAALHGSKVGNKSIRVKLANQAVTPGD
jgi:RNA recognition motif-containing protein